MLTPNYSTISDPQSTQQEQADSILLQEASSTIYPLIWNEQQYEDFERKNSWMNCMLLAEK